jgi:hypothetical protein
MLLQAGNLKTARKILTAHKQLRDEYRGIIS